MELKTNKQNLSSVVSLKTQSFVWLVLFFSFNQNISAEHRGGAAEWKVDSVAADVQNSLREIGEEIMKISQPGRGFTPDSWR